MLPHPSHYVGALGCRCALDITGSLDFNGAHLERLAVAIASALEAERISGMAFQILAGECPARSGISETPP